jgi:enoyl-CoA hydratase/carnithine racemase
MTPDEFAELRYQVETGVALVTLNRPERRNAWSGAMALEYRWALHQAHADPDVRVVVLAGAGDHFCVGADAGDLSEISEQGSYERRAPELPPWPEGTPEDLRHNHTYPLAISTPVIAALHGICAGAGVVLATYADLRFAAGGTRIATSFARLGLPAEYGTGWLLPRIMGVANAAQFLYDGGPISADDAYRLGFVQRILPDQDLLPATLQYARRLAWESSGESLRVMKRQIFIDAARDLQTSYRRSVDDMDAALSHPDFKEGLAAFRAHRPPDFLGGASQPAGRRFAKSRRFAGQSE